MKTAGRYLKYWKNYLTKVCTAEVIAMHCFWYLTTIAVADDDLFTRTIKTLLKSAGFGSVAIARDLHDLRRQQAHRRHDLIVADGELASLAGSDLVLLVRADPLLAPALFIIVTWDVSFPFHETCMRRGADAVIYKPVSADGLATALTGLLTSRRACRGKIVPHPSSLSAETVGSAGHPGSDPTSPVESASRPQGEGGATRMQGGCSDGRWR